MLSVLSKVLQQLPPLLNSADGWDSLLINRRKPVTRRIFRQIDGYRVCLHEFEECSVEESFAHPHPWPAAFAILKGSYLMGVGRSADRYTKPESLDTQILMVPGSRYQIVDPLVWHQITPVNSDRVLTVMVNREPWASNMAHSAVRTTAGKDLEKLAPEVLQRLLDEFKDLL